ncbi:MAG: hypothetical protein O2931_00040 [Planctomycetota bacterium]|nr:hypothetical protein [Planctomycetota bacterium]MDA1177163.1 hypothetical protein [Planctomycetota bacterium]
MVLWIVLGILLLFFGFAAYKSAEIWNAAHIALAAGIFVLALVFIFLAAANLRTRLAWMKHVETLTTKAEQAELKTTELSTSIRRSTEELDRNIQLRGQVWRNLAAVTAEGQGFVLNSAAWGDASWRRFGLEEDSNEPPPVEADDAASGATPKAEPATTSRPTGLQTQTIVFAFAEAPIHLSFLPEPLRLPIQELLLRDSSIVEKDVRAVLRIPFAYLGEFRIAEVDGSKVVVHPTAPLSETQLAVIKTGSPWTLYDTMPRDAQDVFEGAKPEQLQALFMAMTNAAPDQIAPLVEEYLRDRQDAQPADLPERRWAEIKFVKERTFEVDVPAEGESALPDKPFDVSGRARDSNLRQGTDGPATVQPEQTGIFDSVTAKVLIDSGVAQPVREVFVRHLRDYAYDFRSKNLGLSALQDRMSVIQRNLEVFKQSQVTVEQQIEYRTQERDKLNGDLRGFDQERKVLTAYLAQLEARIAELRQTLKTLYLNNQRAVQGMSG